MGDYVCCMGHCLQNPGCYREQQRNSAETQALRAVIALRKALKFSDPCPECGSELRGQSGGGVKCSRCSY